jgi:hypothetical protein
MVARAAWLHVRRCGLGFVHRSSAILCCAVSNVTIRNSFASLYHLDGVVLVLAQQLHAACVRAAQVVGRLAHRHPSCAAWCCRSWPGSRRPRPRTASAPARTCLRRAGGRAHETAASSSTQELPLPAVEQGGLVVLRHHASCVVHCSMHHPSCVHASCRVRTARNLVERVGAASRAHHENIVAQRQRFAELVGVRSVRRSQRLDIRE